MPEEKTVLSISRPTPMWATWGFRVILLLGTFIKTVIADEDALSDKARLRIAKYIDATTVAAWAIGRTLGVQKDEDNEEEK